MDVTLKYIVFVTMALAVKSETEDVSLHLNKLMAYIGESGFQIRCDAKSDVIIKPVWMIVLLEGHQYQRPLVYLSQKEDGDANIEWGEEYNVSTLQQRIAVEGRLGMFSHLQLDFDKVLCEDEGRYTCTYGGYDIDEHFREFSRSADFIVGSLDGPPTVRYRNKSIAHSYSSIEVKPGENIFLTCEGFIGKPKIPILWELNDVTNSQKRLLGEEDGVILGLQMIPENDLCRFVSHVHVNFTMPESSLVVLTCAIAFRDVTLILHPPVKNTL